MKKRRRAAPKKRRRTAPKKRRRARRSTRNPRGKVIATEVYYIEYRHAQDGRLYHHTFKKGRRPKLIGIGTSEVLIKGRRGMVRDYPRI